MSHSRMLRLLARLHRAQRIARATGVPPTEVVARAIERERAALAARGGMSRRRFLALSGAAAATPLLAACPPGPVPPPPAGNPRVAVVGAGIAGLHCAVRLQDLGVDVRVFEAQARVGGRMFTDRETFAAQSGQHCELGGELIDTVHETMFDLAEELGLELYDYRDDDLTLDPAVFYFGGARVSIDEFLAAYAPIAARIDTDVTAADSDDDAFATLDALSIPAWFDTLEADATIQAGNVARQILDVAYNIEYGLETDEQSVLNLLYLAGTSTTELELFGASDERFHTVGGNDAFITGLAARIDDRITTEARLTRIARLADGRHRLSFDGVAEELDFDHVVLAIPFTILRDVELVDVELSSEKVQAINELGYGTNAKLMLGFGEKTWRLTGNSNGESFSDNGYQSTWETSRLQPGTEGIITHYTGGNAGVAAGEGTPEERAAEFLARFEEVFPGVTASHNGRLARFHWPTNAFVKGSYACYRPGQWAAFSGTEGLPEGALHFCGEHTSIDFQGFMEGGALTGAVVADEVAEALGVGDATQALLLSTPAARIMARARGERSRRRRRRRLQRAPLADPRR